MGPQVHKLPTDFLFDFELICFIVERWTSLSMWKLRLFTATLCQKSLVEMFISNWRIYNLVEVSRYAESVTLCRMLLKMAEPHLLVAVAAMQVWQWQWRQTKWEQT